VAMLAGTLNPQLVVVGGELAAAGELVVGPLRLAVQRHVAPNTVAPLEVVAGELGEEAEVMGALVLALQSTEVATDYETITAPNDDPAPPAPDAPKGT
jgi:predicted NBD/HSP70 family sugar kinase